MNVELLITNIGYVISIVVSLGLGILVFVKRPKKEDASINVVFFVMSCAVAVWMTSYVIGINLVDPHQSRIAFMFNLATVMLVVLTAHVILLLTKRYTSQARIIKGLYVIAGIIIVYYSIFPHLFLSLSAPRLYLPNFFVPGPLYWLQDTFFFIVTIYVFVELIIGYIKADYFLRNRLKYFVVSFIIGYASALVAEFLLYGIDVDPLIAAFTGLYTVPMAYAILKYDAIDLNLLAKRTLIYALGVAGTTLFILLIGYANEYLSFVSPSFPVWLVPLGSGILSVVVGTVAWKKMREVDVLKYQFIDVVTHKFRTPLTHIKWSVETLRGESSDSDRTEAINAIAGAEQRLFELTDSLVGLTATDSNQYAYQVTPENLSDVVSETLEDISKRALEKKIILDVHISKDLPRVLVDRKKFQFAIQMVIENAIIYSKEQASVHITGLSDKQNVILSVRDEGIGMSKEDLQKLFSRFYRSESAMLMHTEGLGIGLSLSRDIMQRQGGDLIAESEGQGKGSTFIFRMAIER